MYPGIRSIDLSKQADRERLPNISEILSMVDHFCFYNIPPHPEIVDQRLLHFRDLLNRAVSELILDYDIAPMTSPERELFNKLMDPIRNEKVNDHVTIITTNYDLLIDHAFKDACLANKVDYGIAYRDVDTSRIIYRDAAPLFHYYKLHGSLNWLKCDLCGHFYINPRGSIVHNAFKETTTSSNTCICSDTLISGMPICCRSGNLRRRRSGLLTS